MRVRTQREFKPGEVTRAGFTQDRRDPVLAMWFSSITYIFTNLYLHDDDDHEVLMHAGQLRPKAVYICMIHMRYYTLVSLKC